MINFLVLANMVSILTSNPILSSQSNLEYQKEKTQISLTEKDILDFDDSLPQVDYFMAENGNHNDGSVSDSIEDPEVFLNSNDPEFYWNKRLSKTTRDSSSFIPIEMQHDEFPEKDIREAIKIAGVESSTSYGGCGPIAAMGILDYFARYIGYDEIMKDPTNREDRISLATEVLSDTHFSVFGDTDNTLVWPWDYTKAFNSVIEQHGLKGVITAKEHVSLIGGKYIDYWNMISQSIARGIPVTLFTGTQCGDGAFSKHYTNIYGYDFYVGSRKSDGLIRYKSFIKARLNWAKEKEYYCDADILDCPQVGIITYDVNYKNSYDFSGKDFASDFVNDSGGGQYFFDVKDTPVTFSNGVTVQTSRLRTSWIENQYLVLSPNRANAGTAYLDIAFPHNIDLLEFSAAIWSGLEDITNQKFKIEYWKDNSWQGQATLNMIYLPQKESNEPAFYYALFPRDVKRIRFYTTHYTPHGDRNKGRVILDKFQVQYN